MRLLNDAGRPLRTAASANTFTMPDWKDQAAWANSYDVINSGFYIPSGAEQSMFGISATPRVASIADGSGSKPMLKDTGTHAVYGPTLPLPGPQWITNRALFHGRPSVFFDLVFDDTQDSYAMLTPNNNWLVTSDYFNPTSGYAAPYAIAMVVRPVGAGTSIDSPWDAANGSGVAGPTVAFGNQHGGGGTNITCTTYTSGSANATTMSVAHAAAANESLLIIVQMSAGGTNCTTTVAWRDAAGYINSASDTQNNVSNPLTEMFVGWVHSFYGTAWGIKSSALTVGEIVNLFRWAAPFLTAAG